MRANLFWFSDKQWAKIELLIPMNRPGRKPQNNRTIVSGIMYVLKVGCRWQDCPPEYGPYTTIYNRFNQWSRQGIWLVIFKAITGSTGVIGTASIDSSHVKRTARRPAEKGGLQGVGRSRGGRTTAIHALTDAAGKPRVLLIAPGNVHDVMMAEELLSAAGPIERLIADKAYDTNRLRAFLPGTRR